MSVGGRGGGKLQDLWILSLATLRWELVSPAFKTVRFPSGIKEFRPSVRDGHKAVIYGGDLLLFGGAGSGGPACRFCRQLCQPPLLRAIPKA